MCWELKGEFWCRTPKTGWTGEVSKSGFAAVGASSRFLSAPFFASGEAPNGPLLLREVSRRIEPFRPGGVGPFCDRMAELNELAGQVVAPFRVSSDRVASRVWWVDDSELAAPQRLPRITKPPPAGVSVAVWVRRAEGAESAGAAVVFGVAEATVVGVG